LANGARIDDGALVVLNPSLDDNLVASAIKAVEGDNRPPARTRPRGWRIRQRNQGAFNGPPYRGGQDGRAPSGSVIHQRPPRAF
jgi:hypothetical protein